MRYALEICKHVLIYYIAEKARTLEESAREFQAKHEKRLEYKEVEVKTGEEDESNVLQVYMVRIAGRITGYSYL